MRKKLLILGLFIAILLAIGISIIFVKSDKVSAPANEQVSSTLAEADEAQTENEPPNSLNKTKYSTTDPASIWVVANKKLSLPSGYYPSDLTVPNVQLRLAKTEEQMQISSKIEPAIKDMFASAKSQDILLTFGSGYRSEKLQKAFYDKYSSESGQIAADKFSARPGHSEHQTGLAFDINAASGECNLEICFGSTKEGTWVAQNAYKFGFIIRYPLGKEAVTGYQFEPWHLRYVGVELATELHTNKQVLEEFFGLPGGEQY